MLDNYLKKMFDVRNFAITIIKSITKYENIKRKLELSKNFIVGGF